METKKVVNSQEFIRTIDELDGPVAIIIIGADSTLKKNAKVFFKGSIPNTVSDYGNMGNFPLRAAKKPLSEGKNVITVMHGNASADHYRRHDNVEALRDLGAKSVAMIYVRGNKETLHAENGSARETLLRQYDLIESNAPSPEGIELLFVLDKFS